MSHQKLCDRIKREVKYKIIGDRGADSILTNLSDFMKMTKTQEDFIRQSGYEEADKEILLDIFEAGKRAVENFDKLEDQIKMQEELSEKYFKQL